MPNVNDVLRWLLSVCHELAKLWGGQNAGKIQGAGPIITQTFGRDQALAAERNVVRR